MKILWKFNDSFDKTFSESFNGNLNKNPPKVASGQPQKVNQNSSSSPDNIGIELMFLVLHHKKLTPTSSQIQMTKITNSVAINPRFLSRFCNIWFTITIHIDSDYVMCFGYFPNSGNDPEHRRNLNASVFRMLFQASINSWNCFESNRNLCNVFVTKSGVCAIFDETFIEFSACSHCLEC